MAGKGNKDALSIFLDDESYEDLISEVGLEEEDTLPPPPPPIQLDLVSFALKYADVICPGFELDPLIQLMLEELQNWVEGPIGGRLILSPPPRSSKTTCLILALTWSLLKFPDRGHILISANMRLSSISASKMLTLFRAACPPGYGVSGTSKSKLDWKPSWRGAHNQLCASRGGSLLGYTGHLCAADDILGSVAECSNPELMDTVMRTLGTDLMTRLTRDRAGKAAGLCICNQRLGPGDTISQLQKREFKALSAGRKGTPWTVVTSPFLNPTLDRKAEIIAEFPPNWKLLFPPFGEPGQPVSHRFTLDFAEQLQAQMPPQDWAAMYELDCSNNDFCAWKRRYISLVPMAEVEANATMAAIDMGLTEGGDRSAMTIVGVANGKVTILDCIFLEGDVSQMLGQITEHAKKWNCHTIGVEAAAAGFYVLRGLNNDMGNGYMPNVVKLSHQGKSKQLRQAQLLGFASNGNLLAPVGADWLETLHQQMEVIATQGKTGKKADDLADSCVHAVNYVFEKWIKSGWTPTSASWSRGTAPGMTTATWGYGTRGYGQGTMLSDTNQPLTGGYCPW